MVAREATEETGDMAAVTEVMVVTEDMVEAETGATEVERGAMVVVAAAAATEAAVDIHLAVVVADTGEAGGCPTLLILHDLMLSYIEQCDCTGCGIGNGYHHGTYIQCSVVHS